jgi:hypothetical protein
MIALIEKTGLPGGAWTDHTDHPAISSVDAHFAALRKREDLSESLDVAEPKDQPKDADADKPDVITQAEIADVFQREHSIEDSCASIRRRIGAGSTIEGGRYVVTVDDEPAGYVSSFGGAGTNLRDAGEPAESLANLSDSLDAGELKDEEEAIPETGILERKFLKFKESSGEPVKVTLQVWEPVEGVSNHGIDLTEEEFVEALAAVQKMRGEEWAPDPVLADEAVAAMKRASASVRLRTKEAKPQE